MDGNTNKLLGVLKTAVIGLFLLGAPCHAMMGGGGGSGSSVSGVDEDGVKTNILVMGKLSFEE